MSIFDLPTTALTPQVVQAFLEERFPESVNIDYKREICDSLFDTIGAMANTYGGLIFVGVDEDESDPPLPVLPAAGVQPGDRDRLVNRSYTELRPPFTVDVAPVTLESGAQVLVVRVDPGRISRPIVVSRKENAHRVKIRLEARNADADRWRLAELFAPENMRAPAPQIAWNLDFAGPGIQAFNPTTEPMLVVRSTIEAEIRVGTAAAEPAANPSTSTNSSSSPNANNKAVLGAGG